MDLRNVSWGFRLGDRIFKGVLGLLFEDFGAIAGMRGEEGNDIRVG